MSNSTSTTAEASSLLAQADQLAAAARTLEAIELLEHAGGEARHPSVDRRLAELRYAGFGELTAGGFDHWPVAVDGLEVSGPPAIPEIAASELTADAVRRGISSRGSLLVRDLFTDHVSRFVDGIELALTARKKAGAPGAAPAAPDDEAWFSPLKLPKEQAQALARHWVAGAGGALACDSPKLLQMLLETYTEIGLRDVIAGYLGERPILSANKCTLRRVPLTASTDWHQDGAFLGSGIRALNVWIALNDCGVDSPGMDLVPKRFEEVVETGSGGAIFDWAVGPDTVERVAPEAPVVRPQFRAGDALLFDDLFLHRTAMDPAMTRPRYAIESWFFASTGYPSGQVPLVW